MTRPALRRTLKIALLGAASALLVALLEVAYLIAAHRRGLTVRLSSDYIWMVPAAYLLVFGAVALVLIALALLLPRAPWRRIAVGVFAGLVTLSILLSYGRPLYREAIVVLALGVGVQASRMTHTWLARRAWHVLPAATALMALVLAVPAWQLERQLQARERATADALPAAPAGAPNVLLIILDTVRARSMGLYGGPRDNTPSLERFATDATVFDAAIAPSPWTLPSHASFFTGRWPTELSAGWQTPLDAAHPTLAEALRARGYHTAGFVANLLFATRSSGLARGFVEYDDYPTSVGQTLLSAALVREVGCHPFVRRVIGYHDLLNRRTAADITGTFLDWHERREDRPWFAFLNYYDAHEPLWPPADPAAPAEYEHRCSAATGADAHIDKDELDEDGRRAFEASYELAIGRIDEQLGRLFDELERRGVLDSTIVVIASDHGEQFGEHRLFHHHNSLYMPALHVPLLIRYPPAAPRGARVDAIATLRDLPATIMQLAGADTSAFPGASLARHWNGGATRAGDDAAFAHLARGSAQQPWYPIARGPHMFSLTHDGLHYSLNPDGSEELYDLRRDPGELHNLIGSAPADSLAVLRARLQSIITAPGPPPRP